MTIGKDAKKHWSPMKFCLVLILFCVSTIIVAFFFLGALEKNFQALPNSTATGTTLPVSVSYTVIEEDPSIHSKITGSRMLDGNLLIDYEGPKPRLEGLPSERYEIRDSFVIVRNYDNEYFRLIFGTASDVYAFGSEPQTVQNTHSFAEGRKLSDTDFNASFSNGKIRINGLGLMANLSFFYERTNGVRVYPSLTSANLPLKRLSSSGYKYNITIPSVPANIGYAGFKIDKGSNLYFANDTEGIISVCDGETGCIDFDFRDVPLNYTINGSEFRMDVKGLTNIRIDPTVTFSTASITSIALTPLSNNSFIVVYCDDTADDISFVIYDTNGTNITKTNSDAIDVDTTAGTCDRSLLSATDVSVSAFNSTLFVVGWYDDVDSDVTYAIYNSTGTLKLGPIDVDTTAGNGFSVSVSTFNSTHFVIGWYDDIDDDATFVINDTTGTWAGIGPIDADTTAGSSYAVSVSTFNSTHFVIGWYNNTALSIQFSVYNSIGTKASGPINVATNVAVSKTTSVSTFNSTHFVIGWYDNTNNDATYSVYDSTGTLKLGPIDADTTAGDGSSVSVSTFNSTHFVISWYDAVDFDLTYLINSTENLLAIGPNDIESWPTAANIPFKYQSSTSQEVGSNLALCNQNWIIAYANTTTQANWRSFYPNGTSWNGVCPSGAPPADITPPSYSNNGTSNANPAPLENVLYYANWTDNVGLSGWIFSWNATGALCNGGFSNDTWVAFGAGTWSNVTKQMPLACAGKTIDFIFYANDTNNNWNNTGDTYENEANLPQVTINSPTNTTYTSNPIFFNVTLNVNGSWCGYSLNGTTNVTMFNVSGQWRNNQTLGNSAYISTFYCNDTAGNMNGTEQKGFTVNVAADSCTPLISSTWVITDKCVKTASVNNCPYGTNITATGSLNFTGAGVVFNTSFIFWSPRSPPNYPFRLNWEQGAKVFWSSCT